MGWRGWKSLRCSKDRCSYGYGVAGNVLEVVIFSLLVVAFSFPYSILIKGIERIWEERGGRDRFGSTIMSTQ